MSDLMNNMPPVPDMPLPPGASTIGSEAEGTQEPLDIDAVFSLALDDVPDLMILKAGTVVDLEIISAKLKISQSKNVYLAFAFKVLGHDTENVYDNFHTLPNNQDSVDDAKKKRRRFKETCARFGVPFQTLDDYLQVAKVELQNDPSSVSNCEAFIGKVRKNSLKVENTDQGPRNTVGQWL